MSGVKWIKITTNIFDDEKIVMIESLPSADSIIVIWFKLLCLAGKMNNDGVFLMNNRIPYTDEMLSAIFRKDIKIVRMALSTFEQFGMIELVDGVYTIPNWNKHQTLDAYEKKKERDRIYQQERRAKQRLLIAKSSDKSIDKSSDKSSDVAVSDIDKDIDIEIDKDKEKKSVKKKTHTHTTTRTLFEKLLPDFIIPERLTEKLYEWFTYKTERKESYQETGMKVLLRKIENNQIQYGEQAVCDLIDESMANGWKGIIFERLQKAEGKTPQQPKERKGSFDTDDFFEAALRNSYGDDFYESVLTKDKEPPKTAAEDEGIRQRMESLRKELGQ